jgi:hypothetical protein
MYAQPPTLVTSRGESHVFYVRIQTPPPSSSYLWAETHIPVAMLVVHRQKLRPYFDSFAMTSLWLGSLPRSICACPCLILLVPANMYFYKKE